MVPPATGVLRGEEHEQQGEGDAHRQFERDEEPLGDGRGEQLHRGTGRPYRHQRQ